MVEALLDSDYFTKGINQCLKNRFGFSKKEMIKNQQKRLIAEQQQRKKLQNLMKELEGCDKITYLEKMIYPVLYPGLMMLDKERPEDPLTSLAIFLLQNKHLCDTPANVLYTGSEMTSETEKTAEEKKDEPKIQEDKENLKTNLELEKEKKEDKNKPVK